MLVLPLRRATRFALHPPGTPIPKSRLLFPSLASLPFPSPSPPTPPPLKPFPLPRPRLSSRSAPPHVQSESASESRARKAEKGWAISIRGLSRRQLKIGVPTFPSSDRLLRPDRSAQAPAGLCATSKIHSRPSRSIRSQPARPACLSNSLGNTLRGHRKPSTLRQFNRRRYR